MTASTGTRDSSVARADVRTVVRRIAGTSSAGVTANAGIDAGRVSTAAGRRSPTDTTAAAPANGPRTIVKSDASSRATRSASAGEPGASPVETSAIVAGVRRIELTDGSIAPTMAITTATP